MVKNVTTEEFKKEIFNYEENEDWKFEGKIPAIIDFYADWCGPCKQLGPVLEEVAKEFDGKVNVYKVNVENEQELSGAFGIRSIPSVLFIPVGDEPQMAVGALPKEEVLKAMKIIFKLEFETPEKPKE